MDMLEVYKLKKEQIEKQIEDLEEIRRLLKWASRTGDEPDVANREGWKAKIKESRKILQEKGYI